MIVPIRSLSVDVIPQAIVDLPITDVVGPLADIAEGYDELDFYQGAAFRLDDLIEVAVRHYRGHPQGTSTIYIDSREMDVERITQLIRRVLNELRIPEKALRWERQNDPDY